MRHKLNVLAALAAMSLMFFSCANSPKSFTGEVAILHTNDMHAKIGKAPRVAYMLDSLREVYPNSLLVSAGDLFSGDVLVDQFQDKGYPMIDIMNRLRYDVSEFGNHEFDYGQQKLNSRMKQANFPFICANVTNEEGQLAVPKPYVILNTKQGQRIAFVGLLEAFVNNIPSTHPKRVKGLRFENPYETSKKYTFLKDSADALIALTHLGIKPDSILASKTTMFDIIVGGHSHTNVPHGKSVNGTLIAQAGSKFRNIGLVKIKFENGKIVGKTAELIPVTKGKRDGEIEKIYQKYVSNPYFKEVVGRVKKDMAGKEELGCMMTDAYTAVPNVDIAFQNTGGIRVDEWKKGPVTIGQVFELDPFGNALVILPMNAKEIRSLIRFGAEKEEGKNLLRCSGITYRVSMKNGKVLSVTLKDLKGKKLDESKIYRVAISDYILSAFNFDHSHPADLTGMSTSEALINFLKKKKVINYAGVKRTQLIVK
ncbi:MAG: bifunctional metallophosphatase/5'-nucleotidase [Cytophagales bacterium]|nr:bifunctional metallophosphatase/5'-nucleotidase [Cytophagales bacterium]